MNPVDGAKQRSFGSQLRAIAERRPGDIALFVAHVDGSEESLTWGEFERRTNQVARLFGDRGLKAGQTLVVGLPNSVGHFLATWAGWKVGALVLPLNAAMPVRERNELLALARPTVVVTDWAEELCIGARVDSDDLRAADRFSEEALPDVVACPGKAIGSGGSTGRPKIIVDPNPWARTPGRAATDMGADLGFRPRQVQVVGGPLFHNGPFCWANWGLFDEHTVVVMEKFSAVQWLDLVKRHHASFAFLVPTMMKRLVDVPGLSPGDLVSFEALFHAAAPCPPALKQQWIDLVGAYRIYELYGSTEATGYTVIRGDEWLRRPGSVGRGSGTTEIRILNRDREPVAPGEIGEIYLRQSEVPTSYHYVGSPSLQTTEDGFCTVGDLGWQDDDGYLYIADRRVDLVISGGSNVYTAEVEAVIQEFPGVADVAVIGLPDPEWGRLVHAVVEPSPGVVIDAGELAAHCRQGLVAYKVPKGFEFVEHLPRDDSGKLRKRALVEERSPIVVEGAP